MKIAYRESINVLNQGKSALNSFRYLAPRHTLTPKLSIMTSSEMKKKRLGRIESFKMFTEQVIPKIEENIEVRILRDVFNKIPDELARNELLLAYKRRRVSIAEIRKPFEPFKFVSDVMASPPIDEVDVYANDPLTLGEQDIGRVVNFSIREYNQFFPSGPLGEYEDNQFKFSSKFSLMLTEEAFKLTNHMRKINSSRLTEKDYQLLFSEIKSIKEFNEIINDEELYPRIFHDIAITFIERLQKYRKDDLMDRIFTDCYLFDSLVNILVRELAWTPIRSQIINVTKREALIDQILDQIKTKLDIKTSNAQLLSETFSKLKEFKINLKSDNEQRSFNIVLKKYIQSPRRLPERMRDNEFRSNFFGFNTGALLYGHSGSGKSGTLMYSIMWAAKNNWIIVNPPSGYDITQLKKEIKRHPDSGLYLHLDLARDFLKQFKTTNEHLLKSIPVNSKIYGKFNSAGVHEDEPNPNPVFYIPERKVWSNDWEKFLNEEEKLYDNEVRREFAISLKTQLPSPKTILDIVEFGIKSPLLSINALFELMEQLYNLESHRVLVAVDDYNWFFRPTQYPSFRYANQRDLDGTIPAYHLSFCRAFMKFDGHKIKNGVKLVAAGNHNLYKHVFTPAHINFGEGYAIEMNGLKLDDFRMMCEHLIQAKVWRGDVRGEDNIQKLYSETQGNLGEVLNAVHYPLRAYI